MDQVFKFSNRVAEVLHFIEPSDTLTEIQNILHYRFLTMLTHTSCLCLPTKLACRQESAYSNGRSREVGQHAGIMGQHGQKSTQCILSSVEITIVNFKKIKIAGTSG